MKQSIGVRVGRIFMSYGLLLMGIVFLARQEYLVAAMAICLGSGFWLAMDTDPAAWPARPRWQRVLAPALIVTSIALLIVQFVQIGTASLG